MTEQDNWFLNLFVSSGAILRNTFLQLANRRALVLFLLTIPSTAWSQISITGRVISAEDNSALPGISVVEKGTRNGTTTREDGTFTLAVGDPNATLVFSFVGIVTQEFRLKGQTAVYIRAKSDCNEDFFDSQEIWLYANCGVINNPIGGLIGISSPWLLGGVIKGQYSYLTNGSQNEFQRGQIELAHFISNCEFDIDFRWSYRRVSFANDLKASANSFETDFNFRDMKLIAGYSHLNFSRMETNASQALSGAVIGFGGYLNIPLHPTTIAKIGVYRSKLEYQVEIQGGYRHLRCTLRFYKLDYFNELSLGIGARIDYKMRRQRR